VFRAFSQDADDFGEFAKTPLTMPMLVLAGEKASGDFLIRQGRLVATNVEGVIIKGSGHWLMDEAPGQVVPRLVAFLSPAAVGLAPDDIAGLKQGGAGAGTSGLAGIQTTVLSGDPNAGGLYTIRLAVPANTRIEAHEHRDSRSATVISGTWRIGFGPRFDDKALKALPPGSFYTEPAGRAHFAQTGKEPVVVHITGYGPTDTTYRQPAGVSRGE
jgi:uncharacterized RmlC-like cupin family protein